MRKLTLPLVLAALLVACSPKYDWRDYRSSDAPYAVLFPGKPATQTRNINLDGLEVKLTMAAAEVDGVTFAVGSAQLDDASKGPQAALAMKTALVRNINGTVTSDKVTATSSGGKAQTVIEVDAKGAQNGTPMRLIGRFIAKDTRIYQVIIMGHAKNVVDDQVDTFISSFKLN